MSSVLWDSEKHLFRILHFRRDFPARETGSGLAGGKPVVVNVLEGSLDALERFFFSDKLDTVSKKPGLTLLPVNWSRKYNENCFGGPGQVC